MARTVDLYPGSDLAIDEYDADGLYPYQQEVQERYNISDEHARNVQTELPHKRQNSKTF